MERKSVGAARILGKKKYQADIHLEKVVSVRQQILWKQPPVKYGIWCVYAPG